MGPCSCFYHLFLFDLMAWSDFLVFIFSWWWLVLGGWRIRYTELHIHTQYTISQLVNCKCKSIDTAC